MSDRTYVANEIAGTFTQGTDQAIRNAARASVAHLAQPRLIRVVETRGVIEDDHVE